MSFPPLSPALILHAYRQGIFPMADEDGTSNLPNPTGWYDCMHFDSTNAVAVAHSLATAVRDANTGSTESVAAR